MPFINPDIMQAPFAPILITVSIFSLLIPPIAYTGISTHSVTPFKKSRPLPLRPFLQSVSKICHAVIYVAPSFFASIASLVLCVEIPIISKYLSFSFSSFAFQRGRCIFF